MIDRNFFAGVLDLKIDLGSVPWSMGVTQMISINYNRGGFRNMLGRDVRLFYNRPLHSETICYDCRGLSSIQV